jgi:hypothetical protein
MADCAQIRYHLELLSALEASDAPVLSCYLDARDGEAACHRFLDAQAEVLRAPLKGAARMDLDAALEMVRSEIKRQWHPELKGLAIFARSLAGGRFLNAVPTATALEQRLSFHPVPDLLPLLEVLERDAPFTLILGRRGAGIQVLDIDAGSCVPRAWLALPGPLERLSAETGGRDRRWGRKRHLDLAEGYSRFARRVLAAQAAHPIVIAGEADIVEHVASWLPKRSRHRLLEQFQVPGYLDSREAVAHVQERMQARFARRADGMARRVARAALRADPAAVGGVDGSLEMLQAGLARTLLVARSAAGDALQGADRGDAPTASAGALIDLARVAAQRGVAVIVADAQDLRDTGGVACLLSETPTIQLMPGPALPRHLDLVA